MATLVRCDNCGEESGHSPLNWWILDIYGRKVDATGDQIVSETPYHFCSLDCVREFALTRTKDRLKGPKVVQLKTQADN